MSAARYMLDEAAWEQLDSAHLQAEVDERPYPYSALPDGHIRLVAIESATGSSGIRGVVEGVPFM
jgi:hypothetical protein